jgi:phosphoglycolate phosphatase
MLSALLKNEKIILNSAVYIGYRIEDSHSAMQNSLRFLGATWGYQDEKLLSNEAITSCNTIKQFSQYLNS